MKNALMAPYIFVLMNWAAVLGFYHFLLYGTNVPSEIWTTHHHEHVHSEAGDVGSIRQQRVRPAA